VALTRAGFDVSELNDGRELLELLSMTPPRHFRLVVVDQRMPGLHGTEVLARTAGKRTRFIIVSAHDTPEIREAAERYGASAFVRKPIDLLPFLEIVENVLFDDTQPDKVRT
jgi:DNA-binding NtrC family response regulator